MKRSLPRISLALCAAALAVFLTRTFDNESTVAATAPLPGEPVEDNQIQLACPGRVEGRSDTVSVGAAIDGVLQRILVKEGESVVQGEPLAEIGCEDLKSALSVVTAEADAFRQARTRLMRGRREEERQAAAQQTAGARAVLAQAAAQLDRMSKLREAAAVSRADYEQALRDSNVAQAELSRAMRNEELVNAPPLPEEIARADADVRAAEDRIRLAEERLSKCVVRAPMDGSILRVHLREGESFALLSPRPLFSLSDTSGRRVRAEVDERDIAKVRIGQNVNVSCDAYPGQRFSGTVSRIAPSMGSKSVITGDPADKADRDVLEVVATLDPSAMSLPVGLRITVHFLD